MIINKQRTLSRVLHCDKTRVSDECVLHFSSAFSVFVVVVFLYIAYAMKSWEISQGLEIKNPSMW